MAGGINITLVLFFASFGHFNTGKPDPDTRFKDFHFKHNIPTCITTNFKI
jgi:hypothetical protein